MSPGAWASPRSSSSDGEAAAVLGAVDGVGRRAQDRHARLLERDDQLERRLPAELDDDAAGPLALHDVHHVLERQRLEVEAVGGVVVRRDGLGIAVDHDRLHACLAEREGGVDAGVVELDALADAVRPRAEDDDLLARGGRRLVLVLVRRVEVGRVRLELGGAGVDHLERGRDARGEARAAHEGLGRPAELGDAPVREAHLLGAPEDVADRPCPPRAMSRLERGRSRGCSRGTRDRWRTAR